MQLFAKWRFVVLLSALVLTSGSFAQGVAPPQESAQAPKKAKPQERAKGRKRRADSAAAAKKRAAALRAIMAKLDIGTGATVADIGAGDGRDSWVFAEVVGTDGNVYAEEIAEDKVRGLKTRAAERNLSQVHPVLGQNADPGLPAAVVDMAFMHYVYHHFSQPREMLDGLWESLKPGGFLVIADRHRGTLQDWVPRADRAKKHYWLAETTVVREAREEGFAYVGCAEDCWPEDDQFVLVFQRPRAATAPGSDPDLPLPLDVNKLKRQLLSCQPSFQRPVFIALGPARQLIGPLLKHSAGPGLDIVLEEWATQKDERPELPAGVSLPSVMTENGTVALGEEPIDAVFFLDTYHRLFHHEELLASLSKRFAPDGRLYVLDRKTPSDLSRREASHQRKISIAMVKQELSAAGFQLLSTESGSASDRMLLVFGRQPK